jgi:hypothetical protein
MRGFFINMPEQRNLNGMKRFNQLPGSGLNDFSGFKKSRMGLLCPWNRLE